MSEIFLQAILPKRKSVLKTHVQKQSFTCASVKCLVGISRWLPVGAQGPAEGGQRLLLPHLQQDVHPDNTYLFDQCDQIWRNFAQMGPL